MSESSVILAENALFESTTSEPAVKAASPAVAVLNTTAKPAKAAQPKKRPPRPSREEIIRQQANPSTRLVGRQKTLKLPLQYKSNIMHEYIQMNQSKMLDAYERLAALLRLVSTAPDLHAHVKYWIGKNVEIADAQLTELATQRQLILEQVGDIAVPQIVVPESYKTEFEASHPIANTMVATLQKVDAELDECEKLYLSNLIDDLEYRQLFNQATGVIRGMVDRIFKATTPGKRQDGGRFNPAQLAAWLREGNKMIFADIPQNQAHLVQEMLHA